MNPNIQIVVGYLIIGVCAVVGFMGGVIVKQGYDKKKEQNVSRNIVIKKESQLERTSENYDKESKIAKVKISRFIDDANIWLQDRIEQNKQETDKLIGQFNSRGTIHSGMHVAAHIDRVNSLIRLINNYIKAVSYTHLTLPTIYSV